MDDFLFYLFYFIFFTNNSINPSLMFQVTRHFSNKLNRKQWKTAVALKMVGKEIQCIWFLVRKLNFAFLVCGPGEAL